ncbi:uncharacterized protein LOC62_01G000761 [Vanrija pseudolonga]|uniref:Six-hairpin glycosidase n=1 Tax=Vanrija pseudolonga TaxID=143232 RepID=A0AAF1BH70_9TREE|nr:hypothetical protein LOC62_01G000761 [Vanrija pseudolonga]
MLAPLLLLLQLAAAAFSPLALALPLNDAETRQQDLVRAAASVLDGSSSSLVANPHTPAHTLPSLSYAPGVNDDLYIQLTRSLPGILDNAIRITTHSWELGTLTEVLIEVYNPELSPFGFLPAAWNATSLPNLPLTVVNITAQQLASYDWSGAPGPSTTNLVPLLSSSTPRPLVDGAGSLGDPASLGPAAWITANFADQVRVLNGSGVSGLHSDAAYAWAVGNQLAALYNGPRADNGTISQRDSEFQLWSDMGYMIPPFLAYLGLTTNNATLLGDALTQWSLESSALLDPSANLYRHVHYWDTGFWLTGNGWMLSGLVRVLASIAKSPYAAQFKDQTDAAARTAANVFTALFNALDNSGLIATYVGATDGTAALTDSTGTTAVVGAFYRFLVLRPDLATPLKSKADIAFRGVVAKINSDNWLTAVVDPQGTNGFLRNDAANTRSPEGQSLLGALWAARTAAGQ